ncbi:ATP-dependent DNA helicase recQ [Ceratobasidium theobromae]|uniref:DNA 3'-5' helicase n=1 Tax=Ceratobasidium theobromae TaxID=1582974 RepID=A0A5N5QRJ2_9AGAM|nr:ATP-dependent DNA helicase recQ [Ceratobasidium theobromae]
MEKAREILKEVFQFDSFRLAQEQAIERLVVHNKSALVLFPTAGGKSPLISLMRDQVDALTRRKVKAASLDSGLVVPSTLTGPQAQAVRHDVLNGTLKLLYVAPERLSNEGFVELMKQIEINLLAWGHSFRPEYLKIARFVEEFNISRVLCLTATATDQVAEDICHSFRIDLKEGMFKTPVYRPNLALRVKTAVDFDDKINQLVPMLENRDGPVVVYVTLQAHTDECHRALKARGIYSRTYHAGLSTAIRTEVQDWFMPSTDGIVVCTIAFGMGIDKPDLRQVIHLHMPKTPENYSQEVGRAGRDGKLSVCTVFLCASDIPILENFARSDTISPNNLRLWLELGVFGTPLALDGALEANHATQSRVYDMRPTTLLSLYAQLELKFGLLRAITPCYQVYEYTITSENLWAKVDKTSGAAKAVLRYAQPKSQGFYVDVSNAAELSGVPRADLARTIQTWEFFGAVEVKASQVRHRYNILKELPTGKPELIAAIAQQLHEGQLVAEREGIARLKKVIELATGQECLAHSLAIYFGSPDAVPGGSCTKCTQCITGEAVEFDPSYGSEVDQAALGDILEVCLDRDDPRMIARFAIGATSPRLTATRLSSHPLFGSMGGVHYDSLYDAIETICAAAGYAPAAEGSYSRLPRRTASFSGSATKPPTKGCTSSGSHHKNAYSPYTGGFSRGRGRGGYRAPILKLNQRASSNHTSTSKIVMPPVKRGAGSDKAKEEVWPLEIRELEPAEEELMNQLEKNQLRAELGVELAALKILRPLYESRRSTLAAQKNFWGIALGQHPEIGQHLLDSKDAEAMTYLRDVWVERDPKEHRAFTLEFHFDENPFFTNKVLKKYYKYTAPPEVTSEDATPDENGVNNVMVDFDWERDIEISGTTIDWKDAKKALTKLHPRPNMEDIEKQMEDGHNDSITINYGSFFHYFEEKDDEFDIGQTIAEEVFADPIGYFTGTHEHARNNLDSDWEDEDE